MKALIIQPAFLGDAVISLALAEELRRLSPDAFIAYLVRPESVPVITLSPSVNKVFSFDKYGSESGISGIQKKAGELNAEGFDTIFSLHSSKRTRMLLQRLNATHKIGYGSYEELTIHITERIEQHTSKAVRLLQPLFAHADINALPKLTPKEEYLPKAIRSLPRPIITIAPDSAWKTKQWGVDKFKALEEYLNSRNFSTIFTGFTEDKTLSKSFNSLYSNQLNLINKTTLSELVSIIAYSDLLISNDSAPIHIATAVGTKSVVIFGPTVPEFGFAPPESFGKVIEYEGLWCRPCASHGSNECPIHTHECMTGISADKVFGAAMEILTISSSNGV